MQTMAAMPMPSTSTAGRADNKPSGSVMHSGAKKTMIAYRPLSKTKRSMTRITTSASMSSGKMQKSAEDMREELLKLRKALAAASEENAVLKTKIRRTEDENNKKDRQILQLLDPTQNDELRRILTDKKSSANLTISNLKQRVIKLELTVKEKDQALKKVLSDLKGTKLNEMKIQMESYYQEILRLKSQNEGSNNAIMQNDAVFDDLICANKTLTCENSALRRDLKRALAAEGVELLSDDYEQCSKTQLLAVISELQNKLGLETENQQNRIRVSNESSVESIEEILNEKAKLEEKLRQVREDRLRYHNMAETKESELRALRSFVANIQRQSDSQVLCRQTSMCLRAQPSTSQSSGSEFELQTSPQRGSSAPPRSRQKTPMNLHEQFIMSSTVRKIPSKNNEMKKVHVPPMFQRNRMNAKNMNEGFDSSMIMTPRQNKQFEYDMLKHSMGYYAGNSYFSAEPWVMQATVRKVPEPKKSKPEYPPQPVARNYGMCSSSAPSKRPTAYTVFKSPEKNTADESKTKASGDSPRSVDYGQVHNFRQNSAAKKIQKGWKKHQGDVAEKDRQRKLLHIQTNCAARTIQRGWKEHKKQQQNSCSSSGKGDELNLQQSYEDFSYDDDDDVVC